MRYEYYRDRDVAFEASPAKSYLFREEFTSRIWATRYDFPGHPDGRVKREMLPDDTPSGAQGWFINTRRDKFKDPRLREALIYAFDFEWTNKNIMYGSYDRTHSVFQNSDMMAKGKPSAGGTRSARAVPGQVAGRGVRRAVRAAGVRRLGPGPRAAAQGGAAAAGGRLCHQGRQARECRRASRITIEFLIDEPPSSRTTCPSSRISARSASRRPAHRRSGAVSQQRVDDFDFDIVVQRFSFSSTPGDSLRTYFSSQAAALKGSQNLAGIADPAIDALIDRIIAANTRPELVTACRALDRVIRAGRYWIPHWYKASHWIAYWDVFGRPPAKPRYARGARKPGGTIRKRRQSSNGGADFALMSP